MVHVPLSLRFLALGALLALTPSASAQLALNTETRVVFQINPVGGAPLLSINSRLIDGQITRSVTPIGSQHQLGAGTYDFYVNVRAVSGQTQAGSAGCYASLNVSLDLVGVVPTFLPGHFASAAGVTFLGQAPQVNYGSSQAFDPSLSPSHTAWNLRNRAGCSVFGMAQCSAGLSGGILSFEARAATMASTMGACGLTYSSGEVTCQFRFQISQPTTAVVAGTHGGRVMGTDQENPCLPVPASGVFMFPGVSSGLWFDPPLALGYEFQQTATSLFTDIVALPVGIDGDGLFEVQVGGQTLGQFAEGAHVDFRQLLGSNGVPTFRIVGIDPAKDTTDIAAFPVQLAFDTLAADFTMTPIAWRKVGTSCSDTTACAACPGVGLEPTGQAAIGNPSFALRVQSGPSGGIAAYYLGVGHPVASPLPLFCGEVYPQLPVMEMGISFLVGSGACDGAGALSLPIPHDPVFFGLFVTAQAAFLCPTGGIGLTNGIEFPIGS